MSIDRMRRVNELIKREISTIILTSIEDDVVDGVNITRVDTSKDLANAKVFFTLLDQERSVDKVLAALKKYTPFIRGEVSSAIKLKRTPSLTFHEDAGERYQRSIDDIFTKLDLERKEHDGIEDDNTADTEEKGLE